MATIDPERESEVRTLLRESVKAQYVDPARAARVREAVHDEWVRGRAPRPASRWRVGAAAAVAAGIVATVFVARPWQGPERTQAPRASAPLATVRYVGGSARGQVSGSSAPAAIRAGDVLTAGAEISMGGEGSATGLGATLALADGVEVRVAGQTTLRLEGPQRLELLAGEIYIDTNGRRADASPVPLEVAAAGSVIRDIGTRFLVRGGPAVTVRVREGRVELDQGGVRYDASAGEGLSVAANGLVTRAPAVMFGPEWDWIVRATRPQPVDGRTLAEFLAWVEREGGRTVRFADQAVGRSAEKTLVYGAIDGLSVDEALEVVLPSCGLAHRVEGGVITIVAGDNTGPRRR